MQKIIITIIIFSFSLSSAIGQLINIPNPSTLTKVTQEFALSTIEYEYSRPSLRGRVPFVDIEKFGRSWRTGANRSTLFTFNMDVKIKGNDIKAGTYALYTIPGESEWTIVFSKDIDNNGNMGAYKDADNVAKFTVSSQKMPMSIETFTIDIGDIKDGSCVISLLWGKHYVPFTVTTDVDAEIEENYKTFKKQGLEKIADANSQIASYYVRNKKHLDRANEAIDKALEIKKRPFYLLLFKASILRDMGKKKEALTIAKEGLKQTESMKDDYGYTEKFKTFIKKTKKM